MGNRWQMIGIAMLATGLTACGSVGPSVSPNPSDIASASGFDRRPVDAVLKTLVDDGQVVGASALVFKDGEEVFFGAEGLSDRESGRPMARNTLAHIFSMTKPVTGVALLTLHEQGKFELDDPLALHAPIFKDLQVFAGVDENGVMILETPRRPVTVADVVRHTAGFGYGGEDSPPGRLFREVQPFSDDHDLSDFAQALAQAPLQFHPGEQWHYSASVDVQAYLVEVLTGEPYADYVQRTIFDPLGMDETGWWTAPEHHDRVARLYQVDENKSGGDRLVLEHPAMHYGLSPEPPRLTQGGSGLVSTLDDYMKFAQMLVGEGASHGVRILKPETVRLMATDLLPDTVQERSWLPTKGQVGFGVDVAVRVAPPADTEEHPGAVGEFFWDGRSSTLFWVDPQNDLTAVLFLQVYPFDHKAHNMFRRAVYSAFDGEGLGKHSPYKRRR